MIGAIEAGGTKMVVALFEKDGELVKRTTIDTRTPEETMPEIIEALKEADNLEAIGIGSFGPIGVNKKLDTYGYITSTPKIAWQHFDFLGTIQEAFPNAACAWTTDVNAAAYGELLYGAAKGLENCMYLTVGTGVGAGVVVNNEIVSGYGHPEAGHMILRKHKEDNYEGRCPFHGDCLEGLASGPAIEERWGKSAVELADNDKVWQIQAYYLAQALYNYFLTLSPERFVLGGGVMKQRQLFPLIRKNLEELNKDYVELPDLETFVLPPALEDNAGITGCYAIAMDALEKK